VSVYRNSLTESLYIAPASAAPGLDKIITTRPVITHVGPNIIFDESTVNVKGHNFILESSLDPINLKGVFVSAGDGVFNDSLSAFDFFSASESLSADYPAFNGLPVEYSVSSKNSLTLKLPAVTTFPATVELIVVNQRGYGTLTPLTTTDPSGDSAALQNKMIVVVEA
jgi:hypothetical protein